MAGGRSRKKSPVPKQDSDHEDNDCTCQCTHHRSGSVPPDTSITSTLLQLVNKITDLLEKNSELSNEVRVLKESHKSLLERVESLEQSSGEWKTQPTHLKAPLSDVNALTSTVADELIARKEKELIIVIYGLPELPIPIDSESASEDDEKTSTATFISQNLQVENPELTRVFRMGRRQPERPRPLKVMFSSAEDRRITLEKAKSLGRLPDGHQYRKVFIRPDWTKLQRDQDYIRRQQLPPRPQTSAQPSQSHTEHTQQPSSARTGAR